MSTTLVLQSQGRQALSVRVEHAQRDALALARVTERAAVLAARRDLREAQARQQDAARARKTKSAAVRPSVPVTVAHEAPAVAYVVTFSQGGEFLRTEHAEWQGAADRVVALAHRHGVTYSEDTRTDLAESLRMHVGQYVWDDVRTSADAHYTLTVQYVGAL